MGLRRRTDCTGGTGTRVVIMNFSRGTQRRYATPSPNFSRKLGTVLAFGAGGLIACASGFALLDPELPSARALSLAAQSSSEIAAPVVITATPAIPAAVAKAPVVEPKVAEPAVETKAIETPAVETKVTAAPVDEPKFTKADRVTSCPGNAADGRKGDCESSKATKPVAVQAKTDSPAAVQSPPAKLRVPAAIAFEPAPLIALPPAKAKVASRNKAQATESDSKSTDDARPAKQAALSSTKSPATDGTRPAAETASPAEATPEVAPAPVKPRRAARTQSHRRSSYYEDRSYRRRDRQNFFFPFFR